jgi:hypothetical protein
MKRGASGNRLILKAICIAMTLAFGAGIIATGAMADSDCAMKCCCSSEPMPRHHSTPQQIRSSMGCCSEASQMPCDFESATKIRLPEITLASAPGHPTTVAGPASDISDALTDRHDFRGRAFDPFAREKIPLPPLYLQNLAFLI